MEKPLRVIPAKAGISARVRNMTGIVPFLPEMPAHAGVTI
jgi:hypothetical protein